MGILRARSKGGRGGRQEERSEGGKSKTKRILLFVLRYRKATSGLIVRRPARCGFWLPRRRRLGWAAAAASQG